MGWRPSLAGWRPSPVGWRPSLVAIKAQTFWSCGLLHFGGTPVEGVPIGPRHPWTWTWELLSEMEVSTVSGAIEMDFANYALSHRCPLLSIEQEIPPVVSPWKCSGSELATSCGLLGT